MGVRTILHVARGEVRSGGRQCPTGEVVLVADVLRRLSVVGMMMLCGVWMVSLRLKFRDLHTKPLRGLAAIHNDMLLLVGLIEHCKRIESSCLAERGRSRGGGGVVVEFQSSSRGACAVA